MCSRRVLSTAFGLGLVLSVAGCTSFSTKAREDFAKRFSCPEDKVDVRERPDLNADAVLQKGKEPRTKNAPSPEVAADPARLAKWNKDEAESEASRASAHAGYDVLEVSGCNHKNLVVCHRPTGKGNNSAHPSCSITDSP